jgi:hypothetical protein
MDIIKNEATVQLNKQIFVLFVDYILCFILYINIFIYSRPLVSTGIWFQGGCHWGKTANSQDI